ncbi:MAG: hypothetical protein KIT16_14045 [Rhodospirillaceae bacterium]|nr:hypothetical protein [Rhodospirillaceae bacterium]
MQFYRMPKWKDADLDLVREIAHSGEKYVAAQLAIATSADQRAAVLGGVFLAAGTAIIAGLIAAAAAATKPLSAGMIVGGLAASALFLIAAGLCIFTALPIGFYLPGSRPANWYDDVDEKRDLPEVLGQHAQNFQEKIEKNAKTLEANAGKFKWGAICGIAAPVAGIVLWFVISACWPK